MAIQINRQNIKPVWYKYKPALNQPQINQTWLETETITIIYKQSAVQLELCTLKDALRGEVRVVVIKTRMETKIKH